VGFELFWRNKDFESIIKTNENLPDNTRVEILNKYKYENQ